MTDNYSIDKPIYFSLKWHVFEHSAWFAFCHVFRTTVTYKIGQNDFDIIFIPNSPKNHYVSGVNYFVVKVFFKSFV